MMMFFWAVMIFMFFSGVMVFTFNHKHLLTMLLSLEYIVLCLFMFLFFLLNYFMVESYFMMIYLIFSACEGVLGLSILVSMIRTHGNDYFQSFNVL